MQKLSKNAAILFLISSSANADWYIELTGVDGELTAGEYYTMDINFVTDDPDLNYRDFWLTVDYDQSLLTFETYISVDYDDGGVPFPSDVWEGQPLPYNDKSGDWVYNLGGSELLGHAGEFYPYTMVGETAYMGTLWFSTTETGTYTDLAEWIDGPVTDQVTFGDAEGNPVHLQNFDDLEANKVGITSRLTEISAVPIPGAIFLLGPALLGLIGLRRKKA